MARAGASGLRSLAAGVGFVAGVTLLAVAVVGWQRANARPRREPRHFPGAASVIWRGSRLASNSLGTRVRVAVVRDSASDRYYDSPATMDSIVQAWLAAL